MLQRPNDSDWSKYVPRKLREPMSKKLRPTISNPLISVKEKYYAAKQRYLEGEMEAQKQRYEMAQKEEERRQEEHTLKMMVLELKYQKLQNEMQV